MTEHVSRTGRHLRKHLDAALRDARDALGALLDQGSPAVTKAVLIDDLFGKLRAVLWLAPGQDTGSVMDKVNQALGAAAEQFWSGDIWICNEATGAADRLVYEAAWDEAREVSPVLRLDDRHRNHTAWFARLREPPWKTQPAADEGPEETGPPIVVFYSFKGGVGRTTALAAFAVRRARLGERVAVIDFDLDAPGAGTLLAADERGTTAPWGVADYFLEREHGALPFADYYHFCARPKVTGDGAVVVIPASRIDENYLTKLSRVDFEVSPVNPAHPIDDLLRDVREHVRPQWILVDTRAGLSPAAGLLLSGMAHLHVLCGTTNEQSMRGLELVVRHLGERRLRENRTQADCVVVQTMVPDKANQAEDAQRYFRSRMEDMFRDHYLVADDVDDPDDRLWSVRDMDNAEAPHAPVTLPYRDRFAFFSDIEQIADELATWQPFAELEIRILGRFPVPDRAPEDD